MTNQEAIALIKAWVDAGKPAADPNHYPQGTVNYKWVIRNIPELIAERNKQGGVSVIKALEEAVKSGAIYGNQVGDFYFDKAVGAKLTNRF